MNLKPLYDRVVVKPIEAEEVTAGGIYIPDNAKEKPTKGEVLAVGDGKALAAPRPLRFTTVEKKGFFSKIFGS